MPPVRMLAMVVVLLAGCSESATVVPLLISEVRVDERHVPMPFVVALANPSDVPVKVSGVSVVITSKTLVAGADAEGRVPDGFDCEVQFDPTHAAAIPAGGSGVACGYLKWQLPADPPPMLAVVTCQFEVVAGDASLTSWPVTLVLQSRDGVLDAASDDDAPQLAKEQARRIADVLRGLPGKKSDGFGRLMERLSNVAE